jgi:hypothetical protein
MNFAMPPDPGIAAPNRQWLFAPWFSPTQSHLRGKECEKAKRL